MTNDQDEELCKCCGKVPPAGYVYRHGIYLPNLCFNCYKNHPEKEKTPQRNHSTLGNRAGARS
jgi:hypothetical protein